MLTVFVEQNCLAQYSILYVCDYSSELLGMSIIEM